MGKRAVMLNSNFTRITQYGLAAARVLNHQNGTPL